MVKLMPSAFEQIKENVEKDVLVNSVTRTQFDDIIIVEISSNNFRPENYEPYMSQHNMKITHVHVESDYKIQVEYTKSE